jgi:acetyltransferase-like isoleucine patch superfamily enzyme
MKDNGTLAARIRRRVRIGWLNSKAGVQIAGSVHLSSTAMIQTSSDGCRFGGSILISDGVTISDGVIIATYGGTIAIEPNVYIGPYCILYGHGGLTIGRDTMIGAHTVMVPANHGFGRIEMPMNVQPLTKEGITVAEDVWIGANCSILDDVRIGKGAVIGAGSVVTKDIEAYGVAFGVPAFVVRSRRGELPPRFAAGNR